MKFFYHYNKPLSKKAGKPIISLHYEDKCRFIENLFCNVPTNGKVRKKQPFWVIEGEADSIKIRHKVAFIS